MTDRRGRCVYRGNNTSSVQPGVSRSVCFQNLLPAQFQLVKDKSYRQQRILQHMFTSGLFSVLISVKLKKIRSGNTFLAQH